MDYDNLIVMQTVGMKLIFYVVTGDNLEQSRILFLFYIKVNDKQ